ncbi:MAG: SpoIIE family protein phosphatase [Spirochaetaceae bacterium]|nr:SpoIIE family protein phosphatase [Spirochaetaceae bacterium]
MEDEFIDSSFFSEDLKDTTPAHVRKTGLENSFNERQVGSIAIPVESVSSLASLDVVIEMFEQQPELNAVPVERDDHVIGVIERKTVEENTSSAFKRFVAKTCGDYVKESPFTLNCNDFIEKIAARVNDAAIKIEIKHFIVLVNNRSFYGIMSVAQMNSKLEELRTHDLEKAAAIQQNMLKKNSNTKGFPFSVCIWNRMANAVGGDYYIAKELGDDKYIVGSFDVSGKNVSASLLTVTLGSIFSMLTMQGASKLTSSKLVVMLDNFLQEIVPIGNFITGAICYINYTTGSVEIYNCGHTNVFACMNDEAGKGKVATLQPPLPPFGMGAVAEAITAAKKCTYRLAIKPGLQVNLYSDGFTDMQNDNGERFDEDRTKAFFGDLFSTDFESAEASIEKAVNGWIQNSLLPDDITVMNIRF